MDALVTVVASEVIGAPGDSRVSIINVFDRILFRTFPAKITEQHVAVFRLAVGPDDPLGRLEATFRITGPDDSVVVMEPTSLMLDRDEHGYGVSQLLITA